jgi:hypothetical protein
MTKPPNPLPAPTWRQVAVGLTAPGRLIGLGAAGVITKPFDPMLLAKDLRAVLAASTRAA